MADTLTIPSIFKIFIPNFKYKKKEILSKINLTIMGPSLIAIVGPNGAGKSTLLKLLAGTLSLSQGEIKRNFPFPHKLAYLPQQAQLDRTFPINVEDVITMGFWPRCGAFQSLNSALQAQIPAILKQVGLLEYRYSCLQDLSGGQFQRLLFARIMAQDADIILLDEPFSAVDEKTTFYLIQILQKWHKEGKTIIVILHDQKMVQKYFPYTLLLAKEVIAYGPTSEVLTAEKLLKAAYNV